MTLSEISQSIGIIWQKSLYDSNPLWFNRNPTTDFYRIITPEHQAIGSVNNLILARTQVS